MRARREKCIHANAASPYLTLVDELLDLVEEVTPLPTVLIRLILQFGDFEGYHVLPNGPVQLDSPRTMPPSMRDAVAFRDSSDGADTRWLPFRGGGSLVLSAPLFRASSKRKRLEVNPPLAHVPEAAGERSDGPASVVGMDEMEPASTTTYDTSLIPLVAFHHRKSPWHVENVLLGAHALTHTKERGWVVGVETTLRKSLLEKIDTEYVRLTVKPPPFDWLHQRKLKYYRALPYGINLIADASQPPPRKCWNQTTGTPEEAASMSVRGHEDDAAMGITLVYTRAEGSTTIDVTPSVQRNPDNMEDAGTGERPMVCVTRLFQVAPPSRSLSRADLLTEQGARAFFHGAGRCEYGVARCRERVGPECFSSCCSTEHCAQVNGGAPCAAH